MPKFEWVKKVLLLGSGAIKIGEAGEFDYSGSQAIKALREEGIEVVLVNPNIATIQTDERFVDKVYFLPVKPKFVEEVIKKERPDGILLGFGGQTALNCGVELHEAGILEKYDVEVLGTGIETIELASNREKFRNLMRSHDIPVLPSGAARNVREALEIAEQIGYPVMIRVAYTLGGKGTGVARDESELRSLVTRGLVQSRIGQVLVEKYVGKWKEIEYEIMRDRADNCISICNMENVDPMGIHTGDSIVVAPSQTLTNREYHILRELCFRVVRALGVIGECNVQLALNPRTEEFYVIEVNPRLSRSSALASKATGYPIAYIAAKLAIGYTLPELLNKITRVTTACFEPALDYVVVKIPRWDFHKFRKVSRRIGTQMKSVGEVMAIARSFEEAIQKAVRMLDIGRELTDVDDLPNDSTTIEAELSNPTDMRLFFLMKALKCGFSIERVSELTGIDKWFLSKLKRILEVEEKLKRESLSRELLLLAKRFGFSDRKIAQLKQMSEMEVRELRKMWGIVPRVKQIDSLAAEWEAKTNYLYLTYNASEDDIEFLRRQRKVIVLGSGCYRIGSSVEFDWCCVNLAWSLRELGCDEVIMVNYNPETVSTDYDVNDKLYFEELTFERVLDIVEKESPCKVVVSVGGQIPNKLALRLASAGVELLGTPAESIDIAEDRSKFSSLLKTLKIPQPPWCEAKDLEEVKRFVNQVGYPVLLRPSYVLSGEAMRVAFDERELEEYLKLATRISREHPVVVSKFIPGAREVEVDAVADGNRTYIGAIIEHVENAGVHSGDATMSIPTLTISETTKNKLREYTRKIAKALGIIGPFNIQYLIKDDEVLVIECNLRASRSMPFVSKGTGVNLMKLSARALLGGDVPEAEGIPKGFVVKRPYFSFMRLDGADPVLGVEMVSTGEVACFGDDFHGALLLAFSASEMEPPSPGEGILVSVGDEKIKLEIVPLVKKLYELGYKIYATPHTGEVLETNGIEVKIVSNVSPDSQSNVLDLIESRTLGLVVNIPPPNECSSSIAYDEYLIRRKAVEFNIPLITNLELLRALVDSLTNSSSFVYFRATK